MLIDPTAGVGYAFGQKFPSADATTIVLTLPKALDAIQGGAYSMLSGADGDGTIEFDGTAVPAAGQNGSSVSFTTTQTGFRFDAVVAQLSTASQVSIST